MSLSKEPISVRTTRLNNLILGNVKGKNNSNATVCSSGSTELATLTLFDGISREGLLDAFCVLYNECNKDGVRKRDKNISEFVTKYRPIMEETLSLRVNSNDFKPKALIGKGYFGNVYLVIEKYTNDVYAMKKIKKSVVTTSQVKEERDIMSRRCSEWLTSLQYAFQDNEHLYLVMEYLPGGDLLSLMIRNGPFDEELARFYLAELTLAINAIHELGYVHRDIKPENILIDRFGHIKLADFGNAAALDRDGHVLSLSPVGTPDYIAPELLQTISTYKLSKNLHDVSCDYWSMGIIGYELICETTPFHEDNVHETYSKILSHCEDSHVREIVSFPNDCKISPSFKNLIESLVTNPTKRLGFSQIVKHSFFDEIKWESLRSQMPPIIPNVNGEDDVSNFEDVDRNKGRKNTFVKKPVSTNIKSNDFSGRDLPFVGYSFVHMEKVAIDTLKNDSLIPKLNAKIKDMQAKLKERMNEIVNLKQELVRAEQGAKKNDNQTKILRDAREEITKMKDRLKEKTIELAACRTQMKTLENSVKIEEEMWQKKEATITELLRLNRQKYEEAKTLTEQKYEKQIAEKKNELTNIIQKLEDRENELSSKSDECMHLQEKMENYKEMLRQIKEQAHADKEEFEKNKSNLIEVYEQKINDLRNKLRSEKDSKSRLTMELRDVRSELDDSIFSSKTNQEATLAKEKNNDEIIRRLNKEIEVNKELRAANAKLEKEKSESEKATGDLRQELARLERELQVSECSKDLSNTLIQSPYQTARGSLTDLHAVEEQLRFDLQTAQENEDSQRQRADQLQETVAKLEEMVAKLIEHSPVESNKSVGDMLEKQNEKLEDKLIVVREQMIVERQAARTANLALWKTEKKLEDIEHEKKLLQRRMELTEEKIKKIQTERDEIQRLYKEEKGDCRLKESRIAELKEEMDKLKREVQKEHIMWEKSEQERMKDKSEVIKQISNVHRLEERLSEMRQKLTQSQSKADAFSLENKRLLRELNEEREKSTVAVDSVSELQIKLKNLTDNYERLKYACTITDNQLTEIEGMLDAEQKRNQANQEKINNLYKTVREKDEIIVELKKDLNEERASKIICDTRIKTLSEEISELKSNMEKTQMKLISQQTQLVEQTNNLFQAQEKIEVLTTDSTNLQTMNENYEREIVFLKEESTRVLSELFRAKEEVHRLQSELTDSQNVVADLHNEIDELRGTLAEKENHYLQRDIKAEATLAQHKKLIDYLQLKVEDLSQKKKKTLADMIFGSSQMSSAKKENISPSTVETSILYRTLQEELKREKQHSKTLQDEIEKLNNKGHETTKCRSPLKAINNPIANVPEKSNTKTAATPAKQVAAAGGNENTNRSHRFELSMKEASPGTYETCIVCNEAIFVGSSFWRCRECKQSTHRKCRGDVNTKCYGFEATAPSAPTDDINGDTVSIATIDSVGKYSYEGNLRTNDTIPSKYNGTLIYSVSQNENPLEVNCAFEMNENVVLFGCNSGLHAYHKDTANLVQIQGIDSVNCVAVSLALSKAIFVGSHGSALYQCDLRHLQTRSQANPYMKPVLETSLLDLPFVNQAPNEKWQLVKMSSEAENAIDTVAIAATSTRLVILKYDLKIQKFRPVRALDTATSVSSILFTRHTAIVSSDKFFEIDLTNYVAEEFVDLSDQTLTHTQSCQPVVALRISRQEFLLCFMECGVFVDEYGCRSRPYDLNWEYTPTGFLYQEPFLYISHFQSIQILRIHRSYTKEVGSEVAKSSDCHDDQDTGPSFKRAYLKFYMPTILAESDKLNVYMLAIQKDTGLQEIYHIDGIKTFKQNHNESLETLSSIATSITVESTGTTGSL